MPVNLIHDRQREKGWQKKYHLTDTINNSANRPNSPKAEGYGHIRTRQLSICAYVLQGTHLTSEKQPNGTTPSKRKMTPTQDPPTTAARIQKTALTQMYAWLFLGLCATATTAWLTNIYWGPPTRHWLAIAFFLPCLLAPSLAFLFILRHRVERIPPAISATFYVIFAALLGIPIGYLSGFGECLNCGIHITIVTPIIALLMICLANYTTNRDFSSWTATSAATALSIIIVGSAHLLIGTDTQTWAVALIPTPIAIGLITWSTKDVRKLAHQAATNSDQRLAASIPIICATRIYLNPLNSVIKATKSRAAYWAAGTTWSTAMIAVAALLIYEGMPQAWAAAPYIAWALNWGPLKLWLDTPINHSRPLNILRILIKTAAICSLAAAAIYCFGIWGVSQDPSTPPEVWHELGRESAPTFPIWHAFLAFCFACATWLFLTDTPTSRRKSKADRAHRQMLKSQNVDTPRSQPKPPCPRCGPTKTGWLSYTIKYCRNCRRRFD